MPDVRRPREHEEMLHALCQSDKKIFNSYKDALVFAACLGYSKDATKPFDKSSEPVGMHIFRAEFDEAVFYCLALAESQDVACLSDNKIDERIKCFEEYAAAGLDTIRNRVFESNLDWDDAITELVLEQYKDDRNLLTGIASLADS